MTKVVFLLGYLLTMATMTVIAMGLCLISWPLSIITLFMMVGLTYLYYKAAERLDNLR